jgi:hypothetical protein
MESVYFYLLAVALIVVAVGAWYITKDTPMGRKIAFGVIILIIVVVAIVSLRNKFGMFGDLANWVRGFKIKSDIEVLKKDIITLEASKAQTTASAEVIDTKAKQVAEKAKQFKNQTDLIDSILGKKVNDLNKMADPLAQARADMPAESKDPLEEAKNLLAELQKTQVR